MNIYDEEQVIWCENCFLEIDQEPFIIGGDRIYQCDECFGLTLSYYVKNKEII